MARFKCYLDPLSPDKKNNNKKPWKGWIRSSKDFLDRRMLCILHRFHILDFPAV